jgi:hypothetical protein
MRLTSFLPSAVPLLLSLVASGEPTAPQSTSPGRSPVLVELFTSEGCSSCPPADDALSRLEKGQPVNGAQVIALEWHVDYWNRLGWVDPFSSAEATGRQEAYSTAFHIDGVYTPQVVIDGQKQLVGGLREVAEEIANAARRSKARVQLSSTSAAANAVEIRIQVSALPAAPRKEDAELWLALTESDLQSDVLRGENAGRKLKHASVVRRAKRLGKLSADAKELAATSTEQLDPNWARSHLQAAVFLQERRTGKVLGAALIPLGAP